MAKTKTNAATITAILGINVDSIIEGLNGFNGVEGRMEFIKNKKRPNFLK